MAIDNNDMFPPEPLISGARTLVRNGLMQTDLDANHFRIINLNTSNLVFDPIPTQVADPNKWFNSYDNGTHEFGFTQPSFTNLLGSLSTTQQRAITRVGTLTEGVWHGSPIANGYLPTLNNLLPPNGDLNVNSKRIRNVADPIEDQDAVTLRILNARNSGTQPKAAVRCATTTDRGLAGLTIDVDGVTLVDNDRVLVKDQSGAHHFQNGIWNAHPGTWTRAVDADTPEKLELCTCFVLEGDTNSLKTWLETTELPFYIDITHGAGPFPDFAVFSTGDIIQAGDGLDMSGNTIFAVGTAGRIAVSASGIDIAASYAGQSSIHTLGIVDTGTWEADILDPVFGGTGVNNFASTITLAGNFSTSLGFGAPIGSPLSFALAGPTSLVLPTVGILATRNGIETLTNKSISADQVNSGVLLITNGGTSANTAMAALKNLLPDTTGHADHVLHTDGADVFYWAAVVPGP